MTRYKNKSRKLRNTIADPITNELKAKKTNYNIIKKVICYLKGHDWTSKSIKGILPKGKYKSDTEFFNEWNDLTRMYCDRCGLVSKLSEKYKLKP